MPDRRDNTAIFNTRSGGPPRVLLGVCGGVAAYKAVEVLRRLRDAGMDVRVAMTAAARAFVQPLTFEVLSESAVWGDDYLEARGRGTEEHIVAAQWADLVCLVPATTNTIAKAALGLGDDFLSTTLLAYDGELVVAPAMHPKMWERESTRSHVATLRGRGAQLVGPAEGALASGESGVGRLAEPAAIVAVVIEQLRRRGSWAGRRVVVSAGPTWEPIDPARFIANRSSGKMGFALAEAAARCGAKVTLVAGPVALPTPAGVTRIDVETALEMQAAMFAAAPDADLVIMAAAVADFRVREVAARKIKKQDGPPVLDLEANPDILAQLPRVASRAVVVGFAAETHEVEGFARAKLDRKGVDAIVANDVSRADIGFGSEHNEVVVYRRTGEPVRLPRQSKVELAGALLEVFALLFKEANRAPTAAD